jgi:hypothetical protein
MSLTDPCSYHDLHGICSTQFLNLCQAHSHKFFLKPWLFPIMSIQIYFHQTSEKGEDYPYNYMIIPYHLLSKTVGDYSSHLQVREVIGNNYWYVKDKISNKPYLIKPTLDGRWESYFTSDPLGGQCHDHHNLVMIINPKSLEWVWW